MSDGRKGREGVSTSGLSGHGHSMGSTGAYGTPRMIFTELEENNSQSAKPILKSLQEKEKKSNEQKEKKRQVSPYRVTTDDT